MSVSASNVPIGPLQRLLEREIARRNDPTEPGAGVGAVADEIAATLGLDERGRNAILRRIYDVRRGEYTYASGQGWRAKRTVTFATADAILTGLHLQDVWHTDRVLRRHYGVSRNGRCPELTWCRICREWTLGHVCLWCEHRTMSLRLLAGRNARGVCELCGRRTRGQVGGHRLCHRHQQLWPKLGEPVELQLARELELLEPAAAVAAAA